MITYKSVFFILIFAGFVFCKHHEKKLESTPKETSEVDLESIPESVLDKTSDTEIDETNDDGLSKTEKEFDPDREQSDAPGNPGTFIINRDHGCIPRPKDYKEEKEDIPIEKECPQTQYDKYVRCMRARERKNTIRHKRILYCDDDCYQAGCRNCEGNSCQKCRSCNTCQSNNCCSKSCNNQCNTQGCKVHCKKDCLKAVYRQRTYSHATQKEQNITTIIHLHNIVNNTNVIDIPVNVSSENINNITSLQDDQSISGGNAMSFWKPWRDHKNLIANIDVLKHNSVGQPCCHVILPRECVKIERFPYVRCYHRRRRSCGPHCTSRVVHMQQIQSCHQPYTPHAKIEIKPQCEQQIRYIPQPRPSCHYSQYWPYVSCGNNNNQQYRQCSGCYDHYNSGGNPYNSCQHSCYDDGFGYGRYYRQGPFYRPGYSHVPDCYQIGSCGYGGYQQPNYYGGYPYSVYGNDPNQMYPYMPNPYFPNGNYPVVYPPVWHIPSVPVNETGTSTSTTTTQSSIAVEDITTDISINVPAEY